MAKLETEMAPDAVAEIVEGLTQSLAETAVATVKAQNYHWNVEGMAFGPLHDLFQQIYEDHFTAQDELAERIKSLGSHAEGRMAEWLKRSRIEECDGHKSDVDMVKAMMADQKTISATLLALADRADKHNDLVTNDMAIGRAQVHDKFAWMLRAHVKNA